MILFSKDSLWTKLLGLKEKKKQLVLITHNKSTFNANNKKKRIQKEKEKSPLRLKRREKKIMVSEFLTPIRRLQVFDSVPDAHLLQDSN